MRISALIRGERTAQMIANVLDRNKGVDLNHAAATMGPRHLIR